MDRQSIREQFQLDYLSDLAEGFDEQTAQASIEGAERITSALMCIAYTIGDLAEAVWNLKEK